MLAPLTQLLELANLPHLFEEAARNRASPRPVVSGRFVIGLIAVIAVSGMVYWSYFGELGGTAPKLRVLLGVSWTVGAVGSLFLAGNQLDAALTRRQLAARAARRLERRLARKQRRLDQNR